MTTKASLILAMGSLLFATLSASAEEASNSEYDAIAIALEDIQWGAPGGGNGFPVGVQSARQGTDR